MKYLLIGLLIFLSIGCKKFLDEPNDNLPDVENPVQNVECEDRVYEYTGQQGCDGQTYPDPDSTPYALPFPPGEVYATGLTNCSSSFHAAGREDQYAYDFNMPVGDVFTAIRSGRVVRVVESQLSQGGDGIYVDIGDNVKQGEELGESGMSGFAGYPHLHLIVVRNSPDFPYEGIPISFSNVIPPDVVLSSNVVYEACAR